MPKTTGDKEKIEKAVTGYFGIGSTRIRSWQKYRN